MLLVIVHVVLALVNLTKNFPGRVEYLDRLFRFNFFRFSEFFKILVVRNQSCFFDNFIKDRHRLSLEFLGTNHLVLFHFESLLLIGASNVALELHDAAIVKCDT